LLSPGKGALYIIELYSGTTGRSRTLNLVHVIFFVSPFLSSTKQLATTSLFTCYLSRSIRDANRVKILWRYRTLIMEEKKQQCKFVGLVEQRHKLRCGDTELVAIVQDFKEEEVLSEREFFGRVAECTRPKSLDAEGD
jgi:hypothetical protein